MDQVVENKSRKQRFFERFTVEASSDSYIFQKVAEVIASSIKKGQVIKLRVDDKDVSISIDKKTNELKVEGI